MVTGIDLDSTEFFEFVVGRKENLLMSNNSLHDIFSSKRVLIIGAGGTIGSAISKKLVNAGILEVHFLDRDESALHALMLQLEIYSKKSSNFHIADIRDILSLKEIFYTVKPDLVIHAAALKHLVVLERFPREGYFANLVGTIHVAQISLECGIKQFVNISTDKAANPKSILGKTKKLAELATEEIFIDSNVKNCSVRFGNVFASRGSVIETFIYQLSNELPVTITDSHVARYFMSRSEAANLVLAAASLTESGTYIENMGEEVPIVNVIERIAELLGKTPKIEAIGLQEGEKMHEELYDGPTVATAFNSITRSLHQSPKGIVKAIMGSLPKNNSEAFLQIDQLVEDFLIKN